ncbi:ABC transporter ATP-binding protein [Candidatus Shapirobacteria bacterium]|nr:ABC transporter ATP-binding protein [Candidatus Shapirobacteria bacterium]
MATSKKSPTTVKKTLEIIIWVLKLVYQFSPRLIIAVLLSQIFATTIPFAEQKYLSILIDSLIQSVTNNTNAWQTVFIIFILIRVIKIAFLQLQRIFTRLLDFQVQNKLRKFYLSKTSSLDYQQFEDPQISKLMSKVNEEYQWRVRQIISDIFNLLIQLISFSTVIFLLLPRYWLIAILAFVGEIPGLISDRKWQKVDWDTFNHYNEASRPGWDAAWQLVNKKYIAELKINQAVNWLKSKFTNIQDEFTQARIINRKARSLPDYFASLFSMSIGVLCMLIVINDIRQGLLTIGMFTFYFGIIRSTGDYFSGLLNGFVSISEQVLHISNFRKIIELEPVIKNGNKKSGINTLPEIEFKNVSFHYPNSDKLIYKNLNLTIHAGEEIAIVGPNGAGKSTLVKLICRFYDPTEGEILVNGKPLVDYDLSYWYQHLSLLTQEFNTFPNLSLRENVTVGKSTSDAKVSTALKQSEASDFTSNYKQGLDTMMSQRYDGEEPSWGQWQKIAIARIFYRNTPLMILDEPTASIDAVAESKIFTRLYKQIKRKTLVIISHRFSTVRNAQRIIVIDKGQIVEEGTHQQLMKQASLYAKSFTLQAEGYN